VNGTTSGFEWLARPRQVHRVRVHHGQIGFPEDLIDTQPVIVEQAVGVQATRNGMPVVQLLDHGSHVTSPALPVSSGRWLREQIRLVAQVPDRNCRVIAQRADQGLEQQALGVKCYTIDIRVTVAAVHNAVLAD
jgi:hypothetical protein